jgi:effector-binding domain-containing protein
MITEPKLEIRPEQPYVAIRTQVAPQELPIVIPQLMDAVGEWLGKRGVSPVGAPFIQYHVIDMPQKLDIGIGFPVDQIVAGEGNIQAGKIPGGTYATVLYTGDYSGLYDANRILIEWGKQNNVAWDRWDDPNGDAFAGRFEHYLTDPAEEPDSTKWETEVAIRIRD